MSVLWNDICRNWCRNCMTTIQVATFVVNPKYRQGAEHSVCGSGQAVSISASQALHNQECCDLFDCQYSCV
jgi:hypothetical protein